MTFPFLNRPVLKKITVGVGNASGEQARLMLEGLCRELPELLMTYVAELSSGTVLASYTSHPDYNPNKVSLRNAKVFAILAKPLATHPWLGGPIHDLTAVLADQFHHLSLCNEGKWYCFVAVLTTDANLGVVKGIVRRYAT